MTNPNVDLIAREMIDVVQRVMRIMAGEVRQTRFDATDTQMAVLYILGKRALTLTALAESMAVTTATMTNTITSMEKRGWVARTRSDEDRRLVSIEVTEAGHQVREAITRHVAGELGARLQLLDAGQRTALLTSLELLKAAFTPPIEPPTVSHTD